MPYNAKGYDEIISQLGVKKIQYTVGTEDGYGHWVLTRGLAGQGANADFDGKCNGNKYENGFLYIFGDTIEEETAQLMQLELADDGTMAIRIPETEHEGQVKVIGTENLSDWSNPVRLKKNGQVWTMPDGKEPPKSFFYRVVMTE